MNDFKLCWLRILLPLLVGGMGGSFLCFAGPSEPQLIPSLADGQALFDETGILRTGELKPLLEILSEHQRLTDQKIIFAILKDPAGNETEESWTKKIFHSWKLDASVKGDNLLLVVFPKSGTTRTQFGFGLDSRLDMTEANSALHECLKKKNLSASITKSLFCAAYRILELLNSPLMESGKAAEIAQDAEISEPLNPTGEPEVPWSTVIALATGILVLLLAVGKILLRGRPIKETWIGRFVFWKKENPESFMPSNLEKEGKTFEDEYRE
ncbi:MAG: hypothetical protein HYX41_03800 [Bdellovibrio sp.]|nr:hypothetical protein [Bdellovibrio sp.]